MSLTDSQRGRYARQIVLPGFGEAAQEELARGSALVVGAGGLGAPSMLYLAAAGVGRIGVIDDDRVDRTNLHRQIIYDERDIGRYKVEAAADRLRALNPDIHVEPIRDRISSQNAIELIKRYDVVLDGTDRFETRYLINDACVLAGRPNVYGSVFRFEGQIAVLALDDGPCYRCIFPEPPPPGTVPDCAEGGVIGAVPGVIGSMQALEAIKLLAGVGTGAGSSLLMVDGLHGGTRSVRIRKDPACPICGESPSIHALIDYDAFCGIGGSDPATITARQLSEQLRNGNPPRILDVRTPEERQQASIGGQFIPLSELDKRLDEVPDVDVVVLCRSGKRSDVAARMLLDAGRRHVRNLEGGIDAWRREVDPTLPPA